MLNGLRLIKKNLLIAIKKIVLGTSFSEIKLIVIGCQKGGTTALYNYLSKHPDIDVPTKKELNYFNSLGVKTESLKDYKQLLPYRFGRKANFTSIDVSPSYMLDSKLVSSKIYNIAPKTKIVVLLREPVSRAISSWFMYKKLYAENPDWFMQSSWVKNNQSKVIAKRQGSFGLDFEMDIKEEIKVIESGRRIEFPIVEYGLYKDQIKHFTDQFGSENVLILSSHYLKESTQDCINEIFKFIDLPAHTLNAKDLLPHFVGDNKQEIDTPFLEELASYYSQKNKGLESFIGNEFEWESS